MSLWTISQGISAMLFAGFVVSLVALNLFDEVHLDWLVVGHTKFSPDRMFGVLSKILHFSDWYSKSEVAGEINKHHQNPYSANLLHQVTNFSSTLAQHFCDKKFPIKTQPPPKNGSGCPKPTQKHIGIKKLQGISVTKDANSEVHVKGILRHKPSKEILEEMIKKSHGVVRKPSPFHDFIPALLEKYNSIPVQNFVGEFEVELCVLKKKGCWSGASDSFVDPKDAVNFALPSKPIAAKLLDDLLKARLYLPAHLQNEYVSFWAGIPEDVQSVLLRYKIPINVNLSNEQQQLLIQMARNLNAPPKHSNSSPPPSPSPSPVISPFPVPSPSPAPVTSQPPNECLPPDHFWGQPVEMSRENEKILFKTTPHKPTHSPCINISLPEPPPVHSSRRTKKAPQYLANFEVQFAPGMTFKKKK